MSDTKVKTDRDIIIDLDRRIRVLEHDLAMLRANFYKTPLPSYALHDPALNYLAKEQK